MFLDNINEGLDIFKCPILRDFPLDPVRISRHPNPKLRSQIYDREAASRMLNEGACALSRVPLNIHDHGPLESVNDEMLFFLLAARKSLDIQSHKEGTARYDLYNEEIREFLNYYAEDAERRIYLNSINQKLDVLENCVIILSLFENDELNLIENLRRAYNQFQEPLNSLTRSLNRKQRLEELATQVAQEIAGHADFGAGFFFQFGAQARRQREEMQSLLARQRRYQAEAESLDIDIQILNNNIASLEENIQIAKESLREFLIANGLADVSVDCIYNLLEFGIGDLNKVQELADKEMAIINSFPELNNEIEEFCNIKSDSFNVIKLQLDNDYKLAQREGVLDNLARIVTDTRTNFLELENLQKSVALKIEDVENRLKAKCDELGYEHDVIKEVPVIENLKDLNKRQIKEVANCRQFKARTEAKHDNLWSEQLDIISVQMKDAIFQRRKVDAVALKSQLEHHGRLRLRS